LTRANDPKLVAIGQKIWRGGDADRDVPACSGCHGPAGAGVPAPYPRLSGQYQEYTELQLQHFRDGTRSNDPDAVMRSIAHRLTNEEIKALSDYAAGVY
jgi:cytochrome c553